MTAYPQAPLPYPVPPLNPRPTSVTVLAIIGIVLGSLGVLGGICGLVPYLMTSGTPNPVMELVKANTVWFAWTILGSIVGWVLAILLLAASIAALSLRSWARGAMLFYAVCQFVLGAVGLAVFIGIAMPAMSPLQNSADPAKRMVARFTMIGGVVGPLVGAIYPIFLVIFMRKARVVAAFMHGGGPEPLDALGPPSTGMR